MHAYENEYPKSTWTARDTVEIQSTSFDSLQYSRPKESPSPRRVGDLYELVGVRALHWVPMPMPTHAHGFWVGMGAILLVMLQFLNTWAQFE